MDLALELGMTVHQIETRMPAGELYDWLKYARKRHLPGRRLELYLAQIAQVTAGGRLADYMLRTDDPAATREEAAAALADMAGGLKIRRHKKKKA